MLSQHFVFAVAIKLFRSFVPASDDAVQVFAENGAVGGFDHGGQPIHGLQLRQAPQRNSLRNQGDEHYCCEQRQARSGGLDDAGEKVGGVPYRPYRHQVGGSATQDEESKQPEDPAEGKIAAAASEIDKAKRDAVVRKGNQSVRDNMQPHDSGIP